MKEKIVEFVISTIKRRHFRKRKASNPSSEHGGG